MIWQILANKKLTERVRSSICSVKRSSEVAYSKAKEPKQTNLEALSPDPANECGFVQLPARNIHCPSPIQVKPNPGAIPATTRFRDT